MIGIYKIQNMLDGKIYIGQSYDVLQRFAHHLRRLRNNKHKNKHLQYAWNKYGEKAFNFEILEETQVKLLTEKEQHWIDKFDVKKYGYNVCLVAQSSLGVKRNPETKRKIGMIVRKGREVPEKQLLFDLYWTQKKTTYQIARELGFSQRSIWKWMKEYKLPLRTPTECLIGKKATKETRQKMSESQRARYGNL